MRTEVTIWTIIASVMIIAGFGIFGAIKYFDPMLPPHDENNNANNTNMTPDNTQATPQTENEKNQGRDDTKKRQYIPITNKNNIPREKIHRRKRQEGNDGKLQHHKVKRHLPRSPISNRPVKSAPQSDSALETEESLSGTESANSQQHQLSKLKINMDNQMIIKDIKMPEITVQYSVENSKNDIDQLQNKLEELSNMLHEKNWTAGIQKHNEVDGKFDDYYRSNYMIVQSFETKMSNYQLVFNNRDLDLKRIVLSLVHNVGALIIDLEPDYTDLSTMEKEARQKQIRITTEQMRPDHEHTIYLLIHVLKNIKQQIARQKDYRDNSAQLFGTKFDTVLELVELAHNLPTYDESEPFNSALLTTLDDLINQFTNILKDLGYASFRSLENFIVSQIANGYKKLLETMSRVHQPEIDDASENANNTSAAADDTTAEDTAADDTTSTTAADDTTSTTADMTSTTADTTAAPVTTSATAPEVTADNTTDQTEPVNDNQNMKSPNETTRKANVTEKVPATSTQ